MAILMQSHKLTIWEFLDIEQGRYMMGVSVYRALETNKENITDCNGV